MEDHYSPFISSFYYIDEGIEEYLKQSLLYTTLELENAIFSAREELARKDEELMRLKILLTNTVKERDETISKCEDIMFENMLQSNGSFTIEEDETPLFSSIRLCSSDSDENAVSVTQSKQNTEDLNEKIEPRKAMPEKGRFLEAVMGAGPLLQTLLVAGPLPLWRHPPPDLLSIDIPPVTLSSPRTSPVTGFTTVKGGW